MKNNSFFDSLFSACFCAVAVIFCTLAFIVGKMTVTYNFNEITQPVSNSSLTGHMNFREAVVQSKQISADTQAACVINGKTLSVIYEKQKDIQLPMASTTKIMTAILALEHLSPDSIVTIHKNACEIEGSSIYLKEGEKIPAIDLIYGLMLESGNDAAAALAIEISGSVEDFALLMNQKAKEWGLENTSFTNPHGLPDTNHYTTAYELALICAQGFKKEEFKKIVSSKNYASVSDTTTRSFSNHNKLLSLYENAVGVKTGYTKEAGRCLVSAAEKDGQLYICVTLHASNDWNIHQTLLENAFSEYKTPLIAKRNGFVVTLNGKNYTNESDVYICLPKESSETFCFNCKVENEKAMVYVSDKEKHICKFELTMQPR